MTGADAERARDRQALGFARVGVALAAIATFARGIPATLIRTWDDGRFLIENDETTTISWDSFRSIWTEVHFQAYHPLHLLSYWIDAPWAGTEGPVLHATNVVLWCVVLLLVLELFRALGLGTTQAVLATLLFGLHPVQVEAVTWVTGRKEILAIGLAIGATLTHLRSRHWNDRPAWIGRVLYVLAALAKTTVLPLPALLVALDVILRRRALRDALRAQWPALALGLLFGGFVIAVWEHHHMIRGQESDRGDTRFLVPATLAHYLATAVWPARTSPLYPLAREEPLDVPFALAVSLGYAVALGLAWRARESAFGRRALFSLIAFVILLAPVLNLIPVYFQWQDRYLCLPLLSLAFLAGAALEEARVRGLRWAPVFAGVLAVALAARTVQYEGAWQSDRALWEHAVGTQPRAFYAWIKLGEVRRDSGDFEGALRAYQRAIEIAPQLRLGHTAFLSALLLRDQQRYPIPEPHGLIEVTQRFMSSMDDAVVLRELAGELAAAGYRDAVTFVLDRALRLAPIDDERLERAIAVQLAQGNEWLARFYLGHLRREPLLPAVRIYVQRERARIARERAGALSPTPP
jgi:tetratricopeptide (TPR) repeat protein